MKIFNGTLLMSNRKMFTGPTLLQFFCKIYAKNIFHNILSVAGTVSVVSVCQKAFEEHN